MKTFSAKPHEVKREWFVVDATDKVLGRLATERNMTVFVVAHQLNSLLEVLTSAVYLLDEHAHYDVIGKVVDEELLSHLYGTSIAVVRTPQGDLFTRNA